MVSDGPLCKIKTMRNDQNSCLVSVHILNEIQAQCRLEKDAILITETFTSPLKNRVIDYFFPWFFSLLKNTLSMDLNLSLDLSINGEETNISIFKPAIHAALGILSKTRDCLKKNQTLPKITPDFKGKIFFNMGETALISEVYNKVFKEDPENTHYDSCDFLNQYFTHKTANLPCLDDLLQMIYEKKIRTIYAHNVSYIRYFFEHHQLFLPAILEQIGVEYVIIDFDTYNHMDGFYYLKKAFNSEESRRFCIMPHIDFFWDQKLSMKNIRYFPIPFKSDDISLTSLSNDYEILITTWSRVQQILYYFKPILFFLSYVDAKKPFRDYQFLFHALSHLLNAHDKIPLSSKMRHYTILSNMYYHSNSLLKFEIIDKLTTRRPIYLYGEEDWKIFFPDLYRGFADQNKLKQMLSEKNYLQILMNSNYSYYENNPMFIRLLNANNPYLAFSSIHETPELSGMRHLEYSHMEELNRKIEEIPLLTENPEFKNAKKILTQSMNDCVDDFYTNLTRSRDATPRENLFEKITKRQASAFKTQVLHYIQHNFSRVQECFTRLVYEDFETVTPDKFWGHTSFYFQKLNELNQIKRL